MKNNITMSDYILANPNCTVREVMKSLGVRPSSVHTTLTKLRSVYNKTEINSAGVYAPKGYPALTQEDVDALNVRRFSRARKRARLEGKIRVVRTKKPIDLTAHKLMEEKDPPMPEFKAAPARLTDDMIMNIWLHMSGKAEGLSEAGKPVSFPILFTRAIEQWHGISS